MKTNITISLSALILTIALSSGCKTNYTYKRPFHFGATKTNLVRYENGAFRTNYDTFVSSNKTSDAKAERDRIIFELLYFIDAAHGEYERGMLARKTLFDVGSDFAILGLSGAGAVAGGEEMKAILAAIAGGVQGAQLTVNKRVFRDHAIEALQAQMNAAMMKRKAEIIRRTRQSVADYPLDLALCDIVQYYYDGTFTRAFQNLVTESKKQEERASNEVSQAIKAATPAQIDDMAFITDQIKIIREAKALDRAKKILAECGKIMTGTATDVSSIKRFDEALEKLGDLTDELTKSENRDKLPQIRKLFETIH